MSIQSIIKCSNYITYTVEENLVSFNNSIPETKTRLGFDHIPSCLVFKTFHFNTI